MHLEAPLNVSLIKPMIAVGGASPLPSVSNAALGTIDMNQSRQSTPLRMSFSDSSQTGRLTIGLVFVGLFGFVCLATFITARANSERRADAISARTDATVAEVGERLSAYNEVLYGVRNDFDRGQQLDRSEFSRIIGRLNVDSRRPGVQVIGAAHLVRSEEVGPYEAGVNASLNRAGLDYPTFAVYPGTTASEVLAIDYIDPQIGNEKAFGLDFLSEGNRRTAAFLARDTDKPAATGPVTLVQETGEQRAILVMLPIYVSGAAVDTVEQRQHAFDGVVYAAFRMGDLVTGILGEEGPSSVALLDIDTGEILYGDRPVEELIAADLTTDNRVGEIEVSGRRWRIFVDDHKPVLSLIERSVPIATFFGGLSISLLFLAVAVSMRSARSKAFGMAAEMTDELHAITESASEAIVSIDDSGSIVAWNRGATEVFGVGADEVMGKSCIGFVPESIRKDFRELITEVFTSETEGLASRRVRGHARRVDGTEFPAEISISSWSARGERFITGFVRDVTAQVEAAQSIQEASDMLHGVLRAATEISIVATDTNGLITLFNSGAELMLGYTADEMIGINTPAEFHDMAEIVARSQEMGIEPGFEVFASAARAGLAERHRWTHVTKAGRRVPVEVVVTARYGPSGELCGFIGVAYDITERLDAEANQQHRLDREREMVAKLTELDEAKNDFVSTMSHELRTPLTSIIGFAELLSEELATKPEPEKSLSMVDMIEKNADRLLALVENLLQLSRFESGAFQIGRRQCNVDQILSSALQAIHPIAMSRGIALSVDAETGSLVDGDEQQLERLFLNLLSNAVKFSHDGGSIEIEATATDVFKVSITDHGIGIPVDEQDKLFTRFFRSRSANEMQIQGTGLGLSIVANIAKFHGGAVDVDSTEGEGTRVTVSLPTLSVATKVTHGELV